MLKQYLMYETHNSNRKEIGMWEKYFISGIRLIVVGVCMCGVFIMGTTARETSDVSEASVEVKEKEAEKSVDSGEKIQKTQRRKVDVGYWTVDKSDLTGAVSTINAEEIKRCPNYSAAYSLQGQAAGVFVTSGSSAAPGRSPEIAIRGIGTYYAGKQPLYVVDGVPVNSIDFLNPNDIKSVSVLKDASSTAIYGARGANGVILVTTKSGF
jgi:TonB-dependent SusC/RagA subfamily outer membrane receptor